MSMMPMPPQYAQPAMMQRPPQGGPMQQMNPQYGSQGGMPPQGMPQGGPPPGMPPQGMTPGMPPQSASPAMMQRPPGMPGVGGQPPMGGAVPGQAAQNPQALAQMLAQLRARQQQQQMMQGGGMPQPGMPMPRGNPQGASFGSPGPGRINNY